MTGSTEKEIFATHIYNAKTLIKPQLEALVIGVYIKTDCHPTVTCQFVSSFGFHCFDYYISPQDYVIITKKHLVLFNLRF